MSELLLTLVAFAVALGLLIAVHEFGHFWVARRLGVRVLRFSIGFGKALWRRTGRDGTEYMVAAVPLGGYVKMLDEREGDVAEDEKHLAFNRQPVAKRFAIVAAGPVFNLLFAVIAYWLMFVSGVPGLKPILGEVEADSMAERAGLRAGQQVVAVDGGRTPTWGAVLEALLADALHKEPAELEVLPDALARGDVNGGATRVVYLPLDALDGALRPGELPARIGISPYRPPIVPVIGRVMEGSAAARGGLQAGDRVAAIDGEPIERWRELVEAVQAHPGKPLTLTVRRGGETLEVVVRPDSVDGSSGPVGRLGAAADVDPALFEGLRAEQRHGPLAALPAAVGKTWEMAGLTFKMLWEMLAGRASTENISGPITIAVYAKASAMAGFAQFLSFLGIVSISLGVLNLLPIPILDGGHLLYYVVEVVTGRPVSERTQEIGQKVGIAIILALMSLAFYNDVMRLAG